MREHILRFMTATFSVLVLAAGCSMSALASDYKPMIRYDRVWENVTYDQPYDVIKCMKFDGTEEINGKTWHRIVTFRKTLSEYDHAVEGYKYHPTAEVMEHEGYLREENGKVYTLVLTPQDKDSSDEKFGYLYIPDISEPSVGWEVSECEIYDFNCLENDTYDGISFVVKTGMECRFKVCSSSTITVGTEECRLINVAPSDIEYDISYPVIEGIGAASNGCLNYHEFITGVNMIWHHKVLNRVLDMDGNVLYRSNIFGHHEIQYGSFSNVGSIEDNSACDEIVYDMMGQPVSAPLPGQIYIKNKRKFILNK